MSALEANEPDDGAPATAPAGTPRTPESSPAKPSYARPSYVDAPQSGVHARLRSSIDLRQNNSAAVMTALVAAVACAMIGGLFFGHFAKTETARGVVSAAAGGFSRLDAPKAGIVSEIYVNQGDTVTAGTPIYMLRLGEAGSGGETVVAGDIRNSTSSRDNLATEAERLRSFVNQIREQQNNLRIDQASLIGALDNQEKSIVEALGQSREKVQRMRKLVQQGYATRETFDGYERNYFEYERQLTEVRLKRVEYRRLEAEKQRELTILLADKEGQRSALENQINALDSQIRRLRADSALQIRAQSSGQVLAITAKVGDSVDAGQFVAAIGDPNAEPLIVLDAPARATGLIKVGQKVVLKYDAFPFKTFGIYHGTVTAISSAAIRGASAPNDNPNDRGPTERQSLYRIEVKPDTNQIEAYGEKKRLRIGSTLTADIVIERRRLIDWVLDPIRAMRGRT